MRIVVVGLWAWVAVRWLSVVVGVIRAHTRFEGPVRREARRACVTRSALTVWIMVGVFYVWTTVEGLFPTQITQGFTSMLLMVSAVAGVLAGFMQPRPRTPETFDIFRLRPLPPAAGVDATEDAPS